MSRVGQGAAVAARPIADAQTYSYGTVTVVSPLSVMLDSEATGVTTACASTYAPVLGDRVLVLVQGADRIVIAAAHPRTCRWELTNSATQAIANNSITAITWDTETADPLGLHTGSGSTVMVPVEGVYACSYSIRFAANATGARAAWFTLNGGTTRYGYQEDSAGTTQVAQSGTAMIYATAGQTIAVNVFQGSGGNLNYTDVGAIYNNFTGVLVG
jgi:hypothetical protein